MHTSVAGGTYFSEIDQKRPYGCYEDSTESRKDRVREVNTWTTEELLTSAVSDANLDSNAQGLIGWLHLEEANKNRSDQRCTPTSSHIHCTPSVIYAPPSTQEEEKNLDRGKNLDLDD